MPCLRKIYNPIGDYGQGIIPIRSGFGWRPDPIDGISDYHFGIDVAAPIGTNVRSADDGFVVNSYFSDSYGNFIEIEHLDGWTTRYAHLHTRLVEKGDPVRAGDIIGVVGQTGRATGPHLHFELRDPDGEAQDPGFCYINSTHVAPYGKPMPGTDEYNRQKRRWIWWVVGGSAAILLTTAIILAATDEEKERNRRRSRRPANRLK